MLPDPCFRNIQLFYDKNGAYLYHAKSGRALLSFQSPHGPCGRNKCTAVLQHKCEAKTKNRLVNIPDPDVGQVIVNYHNQKVTVTGDARGDKILKEIKKVKRRARLHVRKQVGQL